MKKSVKPQLPTGYKPVTGMGDSWKPAKAGESLTGVILNSKVVTMPKRGKEEAREATLYTIRTKDADVQLWESSGLRALQQIKKGKPVYIQFLGMKKIPGQPQPMREYLVATK